MSGKPIPIKEIIKITIKYFNTSIKTYSTIILIIFNLFILYGFINNHLTLGSLILLYLIQIIIYLFIFGITILSLKKFKSLGKTYEKNIKPGLLILILGIWIFYGIAISILLFFTINFTKNIGISFIISLILFLLSYILNYFKNLSIERKRLEKTDFIKLFFEPAGYLFPVYISIILLTILGENAGIIIIIFKTIADIIINSPLNSENPYIFQILGGEKKLLTSKRYNKN